MPDGASGTDIKAPRESLDMAPEKAPERLDVRRAADDKGNAEKMRLLKELAKATKPVPDPKATKGD